MEDHQFNILLGKIDAQTQEMSDLRVDVKGIGTKMDILVGPDGNNGIVKDLKDRVKVVEGRQAYFAGVSGATGVGLGLVIKWAVGRIFGVHD